MTQIAQPPTRQQAAAVASAPAARSDVAPVKTRRPLGYLGAAIALVIVGGLGGVVLWTGSQNTEQVYVAAHAIDRGETIKANDITTLAVAPNQSVQGFTIAQRAQVIGKVAVDVVPRGGLITPSSVAANLPVPDGKALVGLSLKPAQLPSVPLRAGDKVVLTPVAPQNGLAPGTTTTSTDLDVQGTVVDAPSPAQTSGTTVVNVYVSRSVASDLAGRAAAGLVTLYLTSGD